VQYCGSKQLDFGGIPDRDTDPEFFKIIFFAVLERGDCTNLPITKEVDEFL